MYIQPINNNNIMMCGAPRKSGKSGTWESLKKHIEQKLVDIIPSATFKDNAKKVETWKKVDERISRPAENRLIMGATALATQPAIDYYNHKVDKETRTVSRNRTIAKILAGTAVGILVRGSAYEMVSKMTNIKGTGKYSKALLPTNNLKELIEKPKLLKTYRSALSTGLAILAMCITNFAIDAPLTVFLTNKFNAHSKKQKEGGLDNG